MTSKSEAMDFSEIHQQFLSLNDQLRMAQMAAHIGSWELRLADNDLSWSEETCRIFGVSNKDFPKNFGAFMRFVHPDDRQSLLSVHNQTIQDSSDLHVEFRIVRPDGEERYVWTQARIVANDMGERFLSGMVQDITEQKRCELLLQKNDILLKIAGKIAQVCGWEIEIPTCRLTWSNEIYEVLGISPASSPTVEAAINFYAPHCRPKIKAAIEACVSDGIPFDEELEIITPKGRSIRVRTIGQALRNEKNAIIRVQGAIQDITEKRQSEQTSSELAQRLATTLESISDAFITFDRAWHFTYVNREAERLLQRTRSELLGKVVWDEFPEATQSAFYVEYHRALQEGCVVKFEEFYSPLGIWLEVHAYPSAEGLAIYFRDITERKKARVELIRANRALQLLSRCNEALIHAENEKELLENICRLSVDIGNYSMAWVGYARYNEIRSITVEAQAGNDAQSYLDELVLSWTGDGLARCGPAGRAIRGGAPIVLDDVTQDPQFSSWLALVKKHGYRGAVYLPLREKERTFGLLALYSNETLEIGKEEIKFLQELADNLAFGITNIRIRLERQKIQEVILKVATSISVTTGKKFFEQLARNMAEAVGAQGGFVARLLPTEPLTARTIIAVVDGAVVDNFAYVIKDSPCDRVLSHTHCVIRAAVDGEFPHSPVASFGGKAYGGWRLQNSAGKPVGLLYVMFREPVSQSEFITSTLQIFAARAAAELERQDADQRLRDQASLLDKAQDAIIVRDIDNRIQFWNKSAERLYGWTQEEALGKAVDVLLNDDPAAYKEALDTVLACGDWSGEITRQGKNGNTLTVEARWTLVLDDDGKPKAILSINTDITQRKADEVKIQQLAFYDSLTQLPNRALMLDRLQHALATSGRGQRAGAILFIDLDNFKSINDTLGHDKGDLLLQQVATRLQQCVYESDTVARFGGDEFVVLLENLSVNRLEEASQIKTVGEKILEALARPYHVAGYEHFTTASIGATIFGDQSTTVGELLKQADLALYQAKALERNTIRFFDPEMQEDVNARVALEADLRLALQRAEFLLHYQPQLSCEGNVLGAEALVRWRHPQRGMISPAAFIPLAEDTGLIISLGRWVLESACIQLARWAKQAETAGLCIAVNVSAQELRHPNFVANVLAVLEQTGADPSKLKLELTESLLLGNVELAVAKIAELKAKGVGLSLDDFGTGYSSLAYLKRLPLDQLKIDQSFVQDVLSNPNDAAIVLTILALGRSLGIGVIAEGVETAAQKEYLDLQGCPSYQGYYFSRPLPANEFEAYVLARAKSLANGDPA